MLYLVLFPGVAEAQNVSLRYRPGPGVRLQTISDTRMTSVVFGLPSLPDSTVIESDWRAVYTTRVLDVTGDRRRLRVSLDSSRARMRSGASPRVDLALPGVTGLAMDAVVGSRYDVQAANSNVQDGADSGFLSALRARLGGMEFWLPEAALPIGFNYESPVQFPLGAHLTAGGKLSAVESLRGTAAVILDSIRARGTDSLVFLTLSATLDPKTVAMTGEGGVGTGLVSGRIAAALVWSTGWNAMVSAATNARFEVKLRLDRADGPPIDGSVSISLSGRHQVRL
jgi:hypothetical protein